MFDMVHNSRAGRLKPSLVVNRVTQPSAKAGQKQIVESRTYIKIVFEIC